MLIATEFIFTKAQNNPSVLQRVMGKQTIAHSYNGILLSNKNEWIIDICNNLSESQNHFAEEKS